MCLCCNQEDHEILRLSDPIGVEIEETTKDLFNDILIMLEKILLKYGIAKVHFEGFWCFH